MSTPFRTLDVAAPHTQALQSLIQLELANRGYSTQDDPVMAEYIVVMLANQKTPDQVTNELKELVGDEYDDAFTQWVWEQTQNALEQAGVGGAEASTSGSSGARAARNERRRSRSPVASGSTAAQRRERRSRSPDARRGGAEERRRSRSPASRRGERPARDYSSDEAWRASLTPRRNDGDEKFDGAQFWRNKAEERKRNPPLPAAESRIVTNALQRALNRGGLKPRNINDGKELFPDSSSSNNNTNETLPSYQESGGVSIFGRASIPDPRAPAFVPSNSTPIATQDAPQSNGTSIFARIDPMLPSNPPPPTVGVPEAASAPVHDSNFPSEPSETSVCRWNLGCTNPMCPYSHASPANAGPGGDPNALVLNNQNCRFGAKCTNKECTRGHVSPAVARLSARNPPQTSTTRAPFTSATPAAEMALSMDAALPSNPTSRPCRFGTACTRPDCFFSHPPNRTISTGQGTPCRFGLGCTRPDCYYSHPPGVRASANGGGGTAHRLQAFAQEGGDEEMERIIPGSSAQAQAQAQVKEEVQEQDELRSDTVVSSPHQNV